MRLLGRLFALGFLLTMAFVGNADAQPVSPSRASGLAAIASRLASELSQAPSGTVIAAAPLQSDEAAPRGDELVARMGTILGGAIGKGATAQNEPMSLPAARSIGRRAGSFIYVQMEVAKGELRVSADLYPVPKSIWERILRPNPPPTAHAFASARLDAEVRGFLSPVPLVLGKVERALTDDKDLVALACGDVDDDGTLELLTVGRRRIARGRLRQGKFVASHVAQWSELAPIAPAPMREPMAGIALRPRGTNRGLLVDVGLTDRAHGLRLDEALRPKAKITGVPIPLGDEGICARFTNDASSPTFSACAAGDSPFEMGTLSGPTDFVTTGTVITRAGSALTVFAFRDPTTGELRLLSNGFASSIPGVGAQVAIADLDGDGEPEIITGADVLSPDEDALVVHSWRPGDAVRERARISVPAGVRALAACPPDGPGLAAIFVATGGGELWVVR